MYEMCMYCVIIIQYTHDNLHWAQWNLLLTGIYMYFHQRATSRITFKRDSCLLFESFFSREIAQGEKLKIWCAW